MTPLAQLALYRALDALATLRVCALRRGDVAAVARIDYQRARLHLRRANRLYGRLGRAHALAQLNRARATLQRVTRPQLSACATGGMIATLEVSHGD